MTPRHQRKVFWDLLANTLPYLRTWRCSIPGLLGCKPQSCWWCARSKCWLSCWTPQLCHGAQAWPRCPTLQRPTSSPVSAWSARRCTPYELAQDRSRPHWESWKLRVCSHFLSGARTRRAAPLKVSRPWGSSEGCHQIARPARCVFS